MKENKPNAIEHPLSFSPSLLVTLSRSSRVLLVAVLCSGVALAVALGVYLWRPATEPTKPAVQEGPPQPPVIDSAGVDPAVMKAIDAARKTVNQSPRLADAWGRLGMILLAHEFRREANACFTQAEQLVPQEPRWPYFQALALTPEDPEGAIPKLQRAVELFGDAAEAPQLRLAETLLGEGRLEEADREFRRILQQHPDNARAHLGLGRLAYQRGDLEEALLHLGRSVTDSRTQQASHALRAEIYQRLDDKAALQRELHKASSLPDDPPWPDPFAEEVTQLRIGKQASLARADQLIRQSRHKEAVALLEQTLQDYPDAHWAWVMLGRAHLGRNDLPAAEQVLRKAVKAGPELAEAQFYLGVALYLQKDCSAAATCFRKATQLKPGFALAHFNLGHCLKEQGDMNGAIEAFRTTIKCKPDHVPAHTLLGELLASKGQTDEALKHLRQAVQLNPGDSRAGDALEELQKRMAAQKQP
jgi:tetratricopeptide (TPR) repeat protein